MDLHPISGYMHGYFHDYLAVSRGLADNTIMAYRDAMKLLLNYVSEQLKRSPDQLNIEDLDETMILQFLSHLETERSNSARSRNARLTALRGLFTYVAHKSPELLDLCRRVKAIPSKKAEHKMVDTLQAPEVSAILKSVDVHSRLGLRDRAMLMFLYNTGARVQELVDVEITALRLDKSAQVMLTGKGRKQRSCPLWPETAEAIKEYLENRAETEESTHLFLNANGLPLTRFGVRYIVRKYTNAAIPACSSLKLRTVTPHTFRHATALHLIQSGVDIVTVKNWLGHADINTTHVYIEIDIEMKRKALAACSPTVGGKKRRRPWRKAKILDWLTALTRRAAPEICAVN